MFNVYIFMSADILGIIVLLSNVNIDIDRQQPEKS